MKSSVFFASIVACMMWLPQSATSQTVEIREWLVPWSDSRPRDPFVDNSGRVWFVGQTGHYATGEFSRYDLDAGTGPHNLIVAEGDSGRTVWYAGNLKSHIGRLNPDTGVIKKIMDAGQPGARPSHTGVRFCGGYLVYGAGRQFCRKVDDKNQRSGFDGRTNEAIQTVWDCHQLER
jgi:streptogramin lyase